MSKGKVDIISQTNTWIIKPAKRAYTSVVSQWNTCGRKFSNWTEKTLPARWHLVATKIFNSLPIAAAIFFLPLAASAVGAIGFYLGDLAYGPYHDETYNTVYAGASLATIALSLRNLIGFVTTLETSYGLCALAYATATSLLFSRSTFAEK